MINLSINWATLLTVVYGKTKMWLSDKLIMFVKICTSKLKS